MLGKLSNLEIRWFIGAWDLLALNVSFIGVTIETIINCKKMKKGIGKVSTSIVIFITIVTEIVFVFFSVAGIFFYFTGLQWS